MAGYISGDTRKVTTHRLVEMKLCLPPMITRQRRL